MAGNTAMYMTKLRKFRLGLKHVFIPQLIGHIPGMTLLATKITKRQLKEPEVLTFPEFIDLPEASGATLWACRMTFDQSHLHEADIHFGVKGVISATNFMKLSDGAQVMNI